MCSAHARVKESYVDALPGLHQIHLPINDEHDHMVMQVLFLESLQKTVQRRLFVLSAFWIDDAVHVLQQEIPWLQNLR